MGQLTFQATLGGAVNLAGPNTASTTTFTLPAADGTNGQALTTNGTGTLAFATISGTPGGSTTQVQYNNAGAFAGSANMTFNGTKLTLANDSSINGITVGQGSGGTTNTAVGLNALLGPNTNANQSLTAIGSNALYKSTNSFYTTAVGTQAMFNTTETTYAVAVGSYALYTQTTGTNNCAIGNSAMYGLTTGTNNVGVGNSVLNANTTGSYNVCVGNLSLVSTTTGVNNVSVGHQSMYTNVTGQNCTAVGYNTLFSQTGIGYNSALGFEALKNVTSGTNNLGLGYNGGADSGVYNITTESNYVAVGNSSVTNAYIRVAWTVTSDARNKTEIKPVPHGLNFVNQLNPVSFRFKKSRQDDTPIGDVRYGFLAQDILALEGSDSVVIDAKDSENLKYTDQNMTAILVKAIQELKAEFDAYKASHP
jgi:hypothetical protein